MSEIDALMIIYEYLEDSGIEVEPPDPDNFLYPNTFKIKLQFRATDDIIIKAAEAYINIKRGTDIVEGIYKPVSWPAYSEKEKIVSLSDPQALTKIRAWIKECEKRMRHDRRDMRTRLQHGASYSSNSASVDAQEVI